MNIDFDLSDLTKLGDDFEQAPKRARIGMTVATVKAGLEVRNKSRALIDGQRRGQYLKHYSTAITAEVTGGGSDAPSVEVGPESGMPQGGMGRGVEFGSARGKPLPHMVPSFEQVEPQYVEALELVAERSVL